MSLLNRKAALWMATTVAGLVLLALGTAWLLLCTEPGARWVLRGVGRVAPGSLAVSEVDGRICGPLAIAGLVYRDGEAEVRIDRAALEWRPRKLLQRRARRQLDIVSLEVEGVRVRLAEAEEPKDPLTLPDVHLPVDVIVRRARVRSLEVRPAAEGPEAAEPIAVEAIDLVTRSIDDVVEIERFVVRGPGIAADVTGRVEPQGDYPVDLRVVWSAELPEQPLWSGEATLAGTLEELHVLLSLAAPMAARLEARLSQPMRDLGFDATLEAEPFALAALGIDAPELTAGGRIQAVGTLEAFRGEAELVAEHGEYGAADAALTLARAGDDWRIDRLVVTRSPRARLEATGDLTLVPGETPRFAIDAAWRGLTWPPTGEPTLHSPEGRGTATGDGDTYDLDFEALVAFPPAEPGAPAATIAASGRVHAVGELEAFVGEAEITLEHSELGTALTEVAASRDGDRLRLGRLLLTSPGGPGRVEAAGEVILANEDAPRLAFDASWRDLAWPLQGDPAFHSPRGSASVEGDADAYTLRLDGGLVSEPVGSVPIELTASGGRERLTIDRLHAGLAGGAVTARGEVAWQPRVEWRLAVDGTELDPSTLRQELPGRLTLAVESEGHVEEGEIFASVDPLRLRGALRGEPFAATGAVELAGDAIALSRFDLTWGVIEVAAAGRIAPTWALELDLDAPDLGVVMPDASGALTARARLAGAQAAPRVIASALGLELLLGGLSLAELNVQADVDLAPGGAVTFDAEATRMVSGNQELDRAAVQVEGRREMHRLTAAVDATRGQLRLAAEGGLDVENAWRGILTGLDLSVTDAGDWSLAEPAAIAASAEAVELGRLCEVSGEARLCAEGAWRGAEGWEMRAELTALPLALAGPLLPPELELSGLLEGHLAARSDATGAVTAEARLEPGAGEMVYPALGGGTDRLRFGPGWLTAKADGDGLEAELSLPLPDLGQAQADLALPGYGLPAAPGETQPIAASLRAEITDLSFIQALAEQLDETAGRLEADLRISGTLGRPEINGRAQLEEGRARVPELGIRLTELRLSAASDGSETLQIEGGVRSGDGTLTFTGEAPPAPTAERPIRVAVRGRRFTAMDTREIHVLASPDLELTYHGTRLAVTGEVLVPEARVNIRRPSPGVVARSEDVVFVGVEREPARAGPSLAMRIRVVLGDDVEIAVLGLEAEPTGSLLLVEEPGQPTMGTGEIELTGGSFHAYGQDLTIERGRLIFRGPLDEPRVDLRAFRRARDGVVAGLEARGTLTQPEISLWSEPPMDQADQLSYILLGRPMDQATTSEGNSVERAALGLGLRRGNVLAERLGRRFGLEEARVETENGLDHASLVLGRYLSPRLYVAYGVGLFQAVDTLRVRYIMSRRWALEAISGGTAQGGDLLYTLERGR